ncbi:MAG: glucose 1-dehydrogenase [Myxococcota bacterium]|nr:glucose 1-dehydrogenase [Myxococcales bacterium]
MTATPALFDLSGRAAIVTGASRGIGRWIAEGLAEAGADVVVAARGADGAARAAEEIARATGRRALPFAFDVASADDVVALVAFARRELGAVDALVNNAAVIVAAPTFDYPLDGWDEVFAVNARGAFHLAQQCARAMRERGGGSIVNVSSINARLGAKEEHQPVVAYSASKGALEAMTRDLAAKWIPHGIRVNALALGSFDTDMARFLKKSDERLARYLTTIPIGRLGVAEDVKGAAVFLASDAARYVTGATLVVDGGCAAQGGPHVA